MDKPRDVLIYGGLAELSKNAANFFLELSLKEVSSKGVFTAALSGGHTPLALYNALSSGYYKKSVPWKNVHLFWGDERCVKPDNPQSNYGAAYNALISKVPIPAENIHRMHGEADPAEATREYDGELKRFFGGAAPVFDLVLLGLGADGHTLSIFPSSKAVREKDRLVVENYVEKLGQFRLTMTIPLVNNASNIVFLVSGEDKASVLKEVLEGEGRYPAEMIRPVNGRLVWMVDKQAAEFL